jgi:hypothetical protein
MPQPKTILVIALVALGALALVFRVPKLKGLVTGM